MKLINNLMEFVKFLSSIKNFANFRNSKQLKIFLFLYTTECIGNDFINEKCDVKFRIKWKEMRYCYKNIS